MAGQSRDPRKTERYKIELTPFWNSLKSLYLTYEKEFISESQRPFPSFLRTLSNKNPTGGWPKGGAISTQNPVQKFQAEHQLFRELHFPAKEARSGLGKPVQY
jgi:hypothetical protein